MSGLFRRVLRRGLAARDDDDAYDARPAEAAYRRLLELAQSLRAAAAQLNAAQARVDMRARQGTPGLDDERDEIATEKRALDEAANRIDQDARDLRARLDAAATQRAVSGARARLHETRAALQGHRTTLAQVVSDAEDEAIRLEARARGLAELYGQTSGGEPSSP
jgi:chromosome segregation ATPase